MRWLIVISLIILSVNYSFSQDYTFRRMIMTGSPFLKISGKVSVSDSIIVINTDGQVIKYYVEKTVDLIGFKQFKGLEPQSPDHEIRFTLNNLSPISKKETASLIHEIKDNFRNTVTTLTYPLIPTK